MRRVFRYLRHVPSAFAVDMLRDIFFLKRSQPEVNIAVSGSSGRSSRAARSARRAARDDASSMKLDAVGAGEAVSATSARPERKRPASSRAHGRSTRGASPSSADQAAAESPPTIARRAERLTCSAAAASHISYSMR